MPVSQNGFPFKESDTNFAETLNQSKAKRRVQVKANLAFHSQAVADGQAELAALEEQIMNNDPLLLDRREFDDLPFEKQFDFMNNGGKLY
jgi:hypothetical protein